MKAHFLTAIILFLGYTATARTLTIPGDADSVQEAVEMAASGDEILLATEQIKWDKPLIIEDKDLIIRGPSEERKTLIGLDRVIYPSIIYYPGEIEKPTDRPSTLLIKNSSVSLRYLRMEYPLLVVRVTGASAYPVGSSIAVASGSLTVDHCDLHCSIRCSSSLTINDSHLRGFSDTFATHHQPGNEGIPAITVGPGKGLSVKISNSIIKEKGFEGIQVVDVENGTIQIEKSRIEADRYNGFRGTAYVRGEAGFHIQNSRDVKLQFSESTVQAGDAGIEGMGSMYNANPSSGGHGLFMEDTTAELIGGTFQGGNGTEGVVITNLYFERVTNGGSGGHGAALARSALRYQNSVFLPGRGGRGDEKEGQIAKAGADGLSITIDEESTIEVIAAVKTWELY